MNKVRIHTLLGVNTLVIYGLILFLLPEGNTQQWIVIGSAMALMMIAPILIINNALNALQNRATEAEDSLKHTRIELSSTREMLATVTTIDELTGCYNERHFLSLMPQHKAMSERGSYQFTVAVLQVDQFSQIVDNHGLGSANDTLLLFARIVKAALREVDVIARLNPDNFALLLSGASEDDALMIINRISQLIKQIKNAHDDNLKITTSGGLTSFHGTESPEELIANATTAMEFAIQQGRDCVAGYNYKDPEPVLAEPDLEEAAETRDGA